MALAGELDHDDRVPREEHRPEQSQSGVTWPRMRQTSTIEPRLASVAMTLKARIATGTREV